MPVTKKDRQRDQEQLNRFGQALYEALGNRIRNPISARLGYQNSAGATFIKVPNSRTDQPNKYYFHEAGAQSYQGEAFLQPGALLSWQIRYGAPIRIQLDPLTSEWEIVGIDSRYAAQFFDGVGENDNILTPYENLAPGLLTDTDPPSMKARVLFGKYRRDDDYKIYDSQLTIDWGTAPHNAHIPTTPGKARYALVELKYSDGSLAYKYGDIVPASLTNIQVNTLNNGAMGSPYLPTIDPGYFHSGFVRLVFGMTRILKTGNIWSLQDYLMLGGGGGGILNTIVCAGGEVVVSNGNVVYSTP